MGMGHHGGPRAEGSWLARGVTWESLGDAWGLRNEGAEPLGGSADDLRKYLAGEIAKWGKVIREAGIKAD